VSAAPPLRAARGIKISATLLKNAARAPRCKVSERATPPAGAA